MRLIRIVAFVAVGLGYGLQAQAQRNTWPQELPAAHSWFMCSSQSGEPVVAWVDQGSSVVAAAHFGKTSLYPSMHRLCCKKLTGIGFSSNK